MVFLLKYEVLISDALAEELGIVILTPKTGLWKFKDEDRIRTSEARNTGSKHMDLGD
jgi:hypothetical protein